LIYRGKVTNTRNAVKPGIYYFEPDCIDAPFRYGIIEIKTRHGNDYTGQDTGIDWIWQIARNAEAFGTAERKATNGTPWTDWVQTATATPPQEYDLPLSSGVQAVLGKYRKNQFGEVFVQGSIIYANGFTDGQTVATLPEGYRPATQREYIVFLQKTGAAIIASVYVHPDGRITMVGTGNAGYTFCLMGSIGFVAA